MSAPIDYQVLDTAGEKKIAVAILNSPGTLNSLTTDMCRSLSRQLAFWEHDPAIALVVLRGAGDKAFCAGGDLHGMYKGMLENSEGHAWGNRHARHFFDAEYRLDYQIHTYGKPLVCWASGIVMGGGVGLMMGASHRVVTDTTRFAMPEISIGLYPDVAGSWMLSHLPGGTGLFLALTGAQLGASDCLFLGLADYCLPSGDWDLLIAQLCEQAWSETRARNDLLLQGLLRQREDEGPLSAVPFLELSRLIWRLSDGWDLWSIAAAIGTLADYEDPWLARAGKTFKAGSPGSARLSFALLERVRTMSLADVFRLEYIVSLQCSAAGDLREGIRALLIDKDKKPAWKPPDLEQATEQWVQRFFTAPWPDGEPHPLADL